MGTKSPKIIIVLIAYKEEKNLSKFYKTLKPYTKKYPVILSDNKSPDGTFKLAKKLGIEAYQNPENLGYGGNLKRVFYLALKKGADVIIDIHPDGEYRPTAIPAALKKVEDGADFVLGNRFYGSKTPVENGMHVWKLAPLKFLNFVGNLVFGTHISDLHQGFRVYTRNLLSKINYENNSNEYIFSYEIIAQSVFQGARIDEVPVETIYTGEKRGASFKSSALYSLSTFRIVGRYVLAKLGVKDSLFKKTEGTLQRRLKKLDKFYEKF